MIFFYSKNWFYYIIFAVEFFLLLHLMIVLNCELAFFSIEIYFRNTEEKLISWANASCCDQCDCQKMQCNCIETIEQRKCLLTFYRSFARLNCVDVSGLATMKNRSYVLLNSKTTDKFAVVLCTILWNNILGLQRKTIRNLTCCTRAEFQWGYDSEWRASVPALNLNRCVRNCLFGTQMCIYRNLSDSAAVLQWISVW